MKVIRLHAPGDLRQHEEPRPEPRAGEALVRIGAVGICGSDLHWFGEAGIGDARLQKPLVLGHEFAGVIASGPNGRPAGGGGPGRTLPDMRILPAGKPKFM